LSSARLADFVRTCFKRYIYNKYTQGSNTLVAYLMDPAIEQRMAEADARPLTEQEGEELRGAIRKELGRLPTTSAVPVLLTSFEMRRALRRAIEREFPRLAVLSYQELSSHMNIHPIARISL
jgi:type III secretion protein V